jgi:hypothetical protein
LYFDEHGNGYILDEEQQIWVKHLLQWSAWSSQSGGFFVVQKHESAVDVHWLENFLKTKKQLQLLCPVPSVFCWH